MSTENGRNISQVGERIKEERRRLGLSQEAVCVFLEIKTPKTLRAWEAGISAPDAFDLETMFAKGFDVAYIVTGIKGGASSVMYGDDQSPSRRAAASVASLQLTESDADMVVALARRLDPDAVPAPKVARTVMAIPATAENAGQPHDFTHFDRRVSDRRKGDKQG